MAKIFVSVPILGKPELKMMYTMYRALLSSRHEVRLYFNENDSLISRVRNVHISEFYNNSGCDYFMSIDSDLEILNSFRSNNIFDKLVEHDKEFVGGLYAIKKPGPVRCSSISSNGLMPNYDSGLAEMKWLSSGCWCIKKSAIEKMVKAYPELEYNGDDNAAGSKVYGLYIPMLHDLDETDFPPGTPPTLPFRKYLSEDWAFCERWRKIGGKIYADSSIVLKHIGKLPYTLYNVEAVPKDQEPPVEAPKNQPPQPGFGLTL